MGIVAPAKAEKPMNWMSAGRCGRSRNMHSAQVSQMFAISGLLDVHTIPVVDDPEKKVTKELGEFSVQLQPSRPPHEPRYHPPKSIDRPCAENGVDLSRHEPRVVDDERTHSNAHYDIVGNQPKTVVEPDVLRMTVRNASPVGLPLAKRDILDGPVAGLLQSNVDLLSCRRYVF